MPSAPPPADPIADLVDRLERAVVAPRRRRLELVREIEGDLREDLAARLDAGAPRDAAAAAVVAEFGDPRTLATALSVELLAVRGKRFASFAAITAVTLLVAWFLGMTTLVAIPGFRVPAADGWMLQLSRALDVAGSLVVATAVLAGIVIRRSGSTAAIVAVAVLQLAFALALVAGAIAMTVSAAVPAAGIGILTALVALTLLLGSGLAGSSAGVLLRWGALRRELSPARS